MKAVEVAMVAAEKEVVMALAAGFEDRGLAKNWQAIGKIMAATFDVQERTPGAWAEIHRQQCARAARR